MKIPGLFVCVFLGALSLASAQSESQPAPTPASAPTPTTPPGPPILVATNRLQRIFGPTAVVDGVLPEVKRRGGILTRADLDAPVVPGREFRNISVDPHNGQPQGVIFISIRF